MHQLITLLVIFIVVWLVLIIFNLNYCQNSKKGYVGFSAGTAFTLWVLFVLFFSSMVLFFTKPCRMTGPVILMILIVSAVTLQILDIGLFGLQRENCLSKCSKKSKKSSKKTKKCH